MTARAAATTILRQSMRTPLPLLVWFVLAGALAGWFVGGIVPVGLRDLALHAEPWRLGRKADDPLTVAPSRWTFLPYLFGDFDLQMDVELAADTHLDLLVRQVEPRLVGSYMEPFAGRWSALRLSSQGEGPPWRGRDDAFARIEQPGAGVAAGLPATVWVRARGAHVTANVAGKDLGAHVCVDRYGMAALVARGGVAVVKRLEITPVAGAPAWWWARGVWSAFGALGAFAIAAFARARGRNAAWFVATAVPIALLAWLLSRRADLELAYPSRMALALALGGCLLLGVARTCRGVVGNVLVAALAALALFVADGRLRHDHAAIEALFGVDAGNQISEAYAQLVRGPQGLHDLDEPAPRVVLLGGQLLYDRGLPQQHLEVLLRREVAVQPSWAGKPMPTILSLPTVDGWTGQQWRLFAQCFTGFRPQALVLGVPRDEMARDEATGRARSTPADVQRVIGEARAWCAANACRLLVFADAPLPADLLAAVQAAAGDDLVVARDGGGPLDLARPLGERLAERLSR